MVTNPYTLLSHIPPDTLHFMVLGLKDAFFTIPLHHSHSQPLFAFTWTGPDIYQSQQLTWTILPQGFRDNPHFFYQALQRDLQTLGLGSTTLLQYADDLSLGSFSHYNCLVHTATVLNTLGNRGYRVSLSKAQLLSPLSYMGLLLTPTTKIIPVQRFWALTQTPRPQTKRGLFSLLGLLNFWIWVPNFALHAKPLYQATRGNLDEHLLAPTSLHTPIQTLIKHLPQAPLLTWSHHAFFLFCTFSTRTCLRDSVPKGRGGHGASSLLI